MRVEEWQKREGMGNENFAMGDETTKALASLSCDGLVGEEQKGKDVQKDFVWNENHFYD